MSKQQEGQVSSKKFLQDKKTRDVSQHHIDKNKDSKKYIDSELQEMGKLVELLMSTGSSLEKLNEARSNKTLKYNSGKDHSVNKIFENLKKIQQHLSRKNLASYSAVSQFRELVDNFSNIVETLEPEKQVITIFGSNADALANLKIELKIIKKNHDKFYKNLINGEFKYYPELAADTFKEIQIYYKILAEQESKKVKEVKDGGSDSLKECYYNKDDEGWKKEIQNKKQEKDGEGKPIIEKKDPKFEKAAEGNTAIVHLEGWRDQQEDRHVTYQLDSNLTVKQGIEVIKRSVDESEKEINDKRDEIYRQSEEESKKKKEGKEKEDYKDKEALGFQEGMIGSTLNAVLLLPDGEKSKKTITANLGDSRAFIVHIEDNKKVDLFYLSRDHRTTNPIEAARIKEAGGKVKKNRVNGAIEITRCLGASDMFKIAPGSPDEVIIEGTHIPEVSVCTLREKDRFLIQVCDGVTGALKHEEMALIIKDCYDKGLSAEEIAETLAKAAIKKGSKDNITVMVTDLSIPLEKPQLKVVLDGCGGKYVSELMSHNNHFGEIANAIAKEVVARDRDKSGDQQQPGRGVRSPSVFLVQKSGIEEDRSIG